jgi:hypothetical protein
MMQLDIESALELQDRIHFFLRQHIFPLITEEKYSDPAIDKFLGAITGWANVGTRLRWPYRWVDSIRIREFREACKRIIPEFSEQG